MQQHKEDWTRDLAEILFSRKKLIVMTTLVVFAAAVAITILLPPTYRAMGSIAVVNKRPQVSPGTLQPLDVRIAAIDKSDLATEAAILESPDLVRKTVLALQDAGEEEPGAWSFGEWLRKYFSKIPLLGVESPNPVERRVRELRDRLRTEVAPASNVVHVSLEGKTPEWNETFLAELLDQYLIHRTEVFTPQGQGAFYSKQAAEYLQELEKIEDQLTAAAASASPSLIEHEMANNLDLKMELEKQLAALDDERTRLAESVEPLRQAAESEDVQYFAFIDNETIRLLSTELLRLMSERAEALRDFRADSPRIQALNENIDRVYQPLVQEVRQILRARQAELDALQTRKEELEATVAGLEGKNTELQRVATELSRIARERDLLQFSYETFARRTEEAQINSAFSNANLSGDVSIVDNPAYTSRRVFPQPIQTPLVGLLAGVLAGLGLALLAEYLDHRVRRPADVTRNLDLPVVFSLRKV